MKPSELPVALAALEPASKKKKPGPIQPLEIPNIKPKPNIQKNDRTKEDVHQVFPDDVTNIFSPGKTGLNHGKTCLHKED